MFAKDWECEQGKSEVNHLKFEGAYFLIVFNSRSAVHKEASLSMAVNCSKEEKALRSDPIKVPVAMSEKIQLYFSDCFIPSIGFGS
jgi:hypothetical protein